MTRKFGNNPNPFEHYKGDGGEKIFKGRLEEHHVVPREIFNNSSGLYVGQKSFLDEIGFDGENFDRNGLFVPSTEYDATLLGSGMHRGPHLRMSCSC